MLAGINPISYSIFVHIASIMFTFCSNNGQNFAHGIHRDSTIAIGAFRKRMPGDWDTNPAAASLTVIIIRRDAGNELPVIRSNG